MLVTRMDVNKHTQDIFDDFSFSVIIADKHNIGTLCTK